MNNEKWLSDEESYNWRKKKIDEAIDRDVEEASNDETIF